MTSRAVVKSLAYAILGLGTFCFYVHLLHVKPLTSAFGCFVMILWLVL